MSTGDNRQHSYRTRLALSVVSGWIHEGWNNGVQEHRCRRLCETLFDRWGQAAGVLPPPLCSSSESEAAPSGYISTESDNDSNDSDSETLRTPLSRPTPDGTYELWMEQLRMRIRHGQYVWGVSQPRIGDLVASLDDTRLRGPSDKQKHFMA